MRHGRSWHHPLPCSAPSVRALRTQAQAGFAHLAVLLVTVLLSAIAAAFVVDARTLAQGSRLNIDLAQARLLADGIAREAFFSAVSNDDQYRVPIARSRALADGSSRQVQIQVLVEDESAKLDLNRAAPAALQQGFVRRAGLGETKAAALVASIVARRQRDGLTRASYEPLQSGESVLALRQSRDMDGKAFDRVDDLRQLPAMTDDIFRALKPHVTVHGRPTIFEAEALQGLGQEKAAGDGADRTAMRIVVKVHISQGPVFVREAIFSYPAANPGKYRIEHWQTASI